MVEHRRFDGVGLVHKLTQAWLKAGGLPADMNTLAEDPLLLEDILKLVRGEYPDFEYRIDCDSSPRIIRGEGAIASHKQHGMLRWQESLIEVVSVKERYGTKKLEDGFPLQTFVDEYDYSSPLPNACILDFLDRHPGRVPKKWRKYDQIFFLGTIYRHPNWRQQGHAYSPLIVRCLVREDFTPQRHWSHGAEELEHYHFGENDAIAVFGTPFDRA